MMHIISLLGMGLGITTLWPLTLATQPRPQQNIYSILLSLNNNKMSVLFAVLAHEAYQYMSRNGTLHNNTVTFDLGVIQQRELLNICCV